MAYQDRNTFTDFGIMYHIVITKRVSQLFPIYSFAKLAVGQMDIAKADITNNEAWIHILDIYQRNK